jgi:ketosteroid isomerase-like protein
MATEDQTLAKKFTQDCPPSSKTDFVKNLLAEYDATNEYDIRYFTDDVVYKIGNLKPVIGPQNVVKFGTSLMQTIESSSHEIKNIWEIGDTVIVEVDVIFKRKDGEVFQLPNVTIIRFEENENKVRQLQAFIDISPVFS